MKIALIFSGIITNQKGDINAETKLHYIEPCYLKYKKHLLNSNLLHDIDIYIHLWVQNPGSQKTKEKIKKINDLYKPKKILVQICEEKNNFVSKYKSNKRAFDLITEDYDLCFFSRLDIIINKNIDFNKYDKQKIYHNDGMPNQGGHFGDFYFIMNFENGKHFSNLYSKIEYLKGENFSTNHFLNKYIKILSSYLMEFGEIKNDLRAGTYKEVEVYRKFGWM